LLESFDRAGADEIGPVVQEQFPVIRAGGAGGGRRHQDQCKRATDSKHAGRRPGGGELRRGQYNVSTRYAWSTSNARGK